MLTACGVPAADLDQGRLNHREATSADGQQPTFHQEEALLGRSLRVGGEEHGWSRTATCVHIHSIDSRNHRRFGNRHWLVVEYVFLGFALGSIEDLAAGQALGGPRRRPSERFDADPKRY